MIFRNLTATFAAVLLAVAPPAAPAAASLPGDVSGTWTGDVAQVGRTATYPVEIKLTDDDGESDYPALNCGGTLIRYGTFKGYVFFVETIARGKVDATGASGCIDGSVTVLRAGDKLIWSWVGAFKDKPVFASAVLTKTADYDPSPPPRPATPPDPRPRGKRHRN